jgi:hypothetical protein
VKRVAYSEQTFGTDDHLADLVLEYARLLAHGESSDTVTVPGRTEEGRIEPITLLIGPASQITAWPEEGPFDADVSEAVQDIEHRIRTRTTNIATSQEDPGPSLDAFDDLG